MGRHFLVKLPENDGFQPGEELDALIEQARRSPEHVAWFGTRRSGTGWAPAPSGFSSIGLILSVDRSSGAVDGLLARVVSQHDDPPNLFEAIANAWHSRDIKAWWKLADLRCIRLDSIHQIPGRSVNGLSASESFRGSLSFAYWDFDVFELLTDRFHSPSPCSAEETTEFIDSRWEELPRFLVDDGLGDLRLEGHRISFYHIAQLLGSGHSRETLLEEFPTVPPPLMDDVIDFYHRHRSQSDEYAARYMRTLDRQADVADRGLSDLWRQFESRREAGRT